MLSLILIAAVIVWAGRPVRGGIRYEPDPVDSDRRQAYIRNRIRRGAVEHVAGRIFVGFCVIALYIGIVGNHV